MADEKRTPDEWARVLNLLPKARRPGDVPENPMVEGAKHHNRWVLGEQLTREEFERGLKDFETLPLGAEREKSEENGR